MSPDPRVPPEYLAAAEAAGLLRNTGDLRFVAGEYLDEISGERQCLVEYCDSGLLSVGADELLTELPAEPPGVHAVILRTDGEVDLPSPWLRHLTYVRYAGTLGGVRAPTDAVTVLPARPEHDALIADWLVQAFARCASEQGHQGDPEAMRVVAERVVHAQDRRSFVAHADGRPVGHVTLLCDAYDDVTGRTYIELLDTLVDAEPGMRRAAVGALTAAAVGFAERVDTALIGHVVHPTAPGARARGAAIVASLLGRGWRVDHVYWRRPRRA